MILTNNQYKHIMLDVLPMGQDSNSVIMSLAAVPFRFEDNITPMPFVANISIDSSLRRGLRVSGATVGNMFSGEPADFQPLFINPQPIKDVMQALYDYMREFGQDTFPWAKGAGYDLPLLRDSFRAAGVNCPWRFTNERCVRTIGWLRPDIRKVHEEAQDADRVIPLEQCMMQISYIRDIVRTFAKSFTP